MCWKNDNQINSRHNNNEGKIELKMMANGLFTRRFTSVLFLKNLTLQVVLASHTCAFVCVSIYIYIYRERERERERGMEEERRSIS